MTILFAHVHSEVVAAASIRGRCLFRSAPQIVQRLFEGGVYLRAASIRGNTVPVYIYIYISVTLYLHMSRRPHAALYQGVGRQCTSSI